MTLRKVLWVEGILLGQQHFQQWETSLEQQARLRQQMVAPFAWGLETLVVDESALANRRFYISRCMAVFPNGQLVSYEVAQGDSLSCELPANVHEPLPIYLCLATNQLATGIKGYENAGQMATWRAEYQDITDQFDHNRRREVLFGQLNLTLRYGEQPRDGFFALKIAEVINKGDSGYQLVTSFVPTVLKLQASRYLLELLRETLEKLAGKIRVLTERRQQVKGDASEFGHHNLEHFLLLQTFNRIYPILSQCMQQANWHPQQLFNCLLDLTGILCTFSNEWQVMQLPVYQHTDLTQCFSQLNQILTKLLDAVMPTHMAPVKLRKESDTVYVAEVIDSSILNTQRFFLAVMYLSDDPEWITQFGRQAKVASSSMLENIVTSAMPGVRLGYTQRPPSKLAIKSGYEYFYLEPSGEFWEQIKTERSLRIFVPYHFNQAVIELVTVQE